MEITLSVTSYIGLLGSFGDTKFDSRPGRIFVIVVIRLLGLNSKYGYGAETIKIPEVRFWYFVNHWNIWKRAGHSTDHASFCRDIALLSEESDAGLAHSLNYVSVYSVKRRHSVITDDIWE